MTTVRLPSELEVKLDTYARENHESKADLIREALERYFLDAETERDSWCVGEESFGRYGSANGTLSVTYKTKIKEKLRAKLDSR